MWVQAGFGPDSFWAQTPRHFQVAMRGVRKRREAEAMARTAQAYETGAFGALAHHGKLKALKHYIGQTKAQTAKAMAAAIRALGTKSNMTIRRLKPAETSSD